MEDAQKIIESEVMDVLVLQKSAEMAEAELMQNEKFQQFLAVQNKIREIKEQEQKAWKMIETHMIEHGIKNVKGEYGWITIAESHRWTTTDELPRKFKKIVVDTTKLTDTFKLTGKEPKGAKHSYLYYLTKGLK